MKAPSYPEVLHYLNSFVNVERRVEVQPAEERFGLARMQQLAEVLEHPERRYPVVHIAGSKGKGSTAAFLGSILRCAGYRVGLYTSPHLDTIRERFRIHGRMISRLEFARLAAILQDAIARALPPTEGTYRTFFEITTAMAFLYFARKAVQTAVVEVGLGGRLDATNIVDPTLSIITPVSFDHMDRLGSTLSAIAGEKAGIIKTGRPVLVAPQEPEAFEAIAKEAQRCEAPIHRLKEVARWQVHKVNLQGTTVSIGGMRDYGRLRLPLIGEHQAVNAAAAVASAEILNRRGWRISVEAVRKGLGKVHWPARIEVVGHKPVVVIDGAHNGASGTVLAAALQAAFTNRRIVAVVGMLKKKDVAGFMRPLVPLLSVLILTRPDDLRARDPHELLEELGEMRRTVEVQPDIGRACARAVEAAGPDGVAVVTGSFFVANFARRYFLGKTVRL